MNKSNIFFRAMSIFMAFLVCTATFGVANAATDSHTDSIGITATNWSDTLTVSQFDPALGTLTAVEVSFSACVEGSAKFESLDAAAATVTLDLQAEVNLSNPVDGSNLIIVSPLAQQTASIDAFDGVIDFGGTSGNTFEGLTNTQSDMVTLTSAADLAAFTGNGTIDMPVSAMGMSVGTGAGNLVTQFATNACADLTVNYIYEPAGATIGNFVWSDDGNGIQDTGEPGVDAVTVNLLDSSGNLIDTTITANDGSYSFTVDPGTYIVEFVAPSGQLFTVADGGDDAVDSDANTSTGQTAPITVAAGDNDDTIDAGLVAAAPSIDIVKGPENQIVLSGADAIFDITVTNNGDVNLLNVAVTDALSPNCDTNIGALAVGESVTYQCTAAGVTADFTNVAVVSGEDANGTPVSDNDDADVVVQPLATIGDFVWSDNGNGIQDAGEAGVSGVTVNLYTSDGTLAETTTTGPDGDYSFSVNPGSYYVTFIAPAGTFFATQDAGDDAVDSDANMSTGETDILTVGPGENNDTIDAGLVTAMPSIALTKGPDAQTVYAGDVTFIIRVENTGNVDLSNVTVTDAISPECDRAIGDLAVGESTMYECTTSVNDDIINVAAVTANDDFGNTVNDDDDAAVDVIHPSIAIVKGPDMQTIESDGTAIFDITVINDGDVPLTNVTVSDPSAPSCDQIIGDLAVGESVTYQCTLERVRVDFTNTATATGTDPLGGMVEDEDDAMVDVTPVISVEKIGSRETVPPTGGYVEFEVVVNNIGGEEANITSIVDDPYGDILDANNANVVGTDCSTFTLLGGESQTCGFTIYVEGGAKSDILMDIVTVSAEDDEGNPTSDSDTETVTVADGLGTGTPGYWKNHHSVWDDINPLIIGDYNMNGECDAHESCLTISNEDALYLLDAQNYKEGKDKRYTLWRSLVAAWLNISVGGNDFLCIEQAVNDGISWLGSVGNPLEGGQAVKGRQWSTQGERIYRATDIYNNSGGGCAIDRDSGRVSSASIDYSSMEFWLLGSQFTDIFVPFLIGGN